MIINIQQKLAQQIVNTVKDVCGQDINFINQSGFIFASTDEKRIGSYHKIGHKVFDTGKIIEVADDDNVLRIQKGINLPIYHNQQILAVIGITGTPEEVKKYAHLAERITCLLIREQELHEFSRNQADKKHFIIYSLITKQITNKDYLEECLKDLKIDLTKKKRLILIQLDFHNGINNISTIEPKIHQMFKKISLNLYTFNYPNEYLAVIDEDSFKKNKYIFQKITSDYQEILKMAVGKICFLYQLSNSYESALTALKSIAFTKKNFTIFDELTLDIILSDINQNRREEFRQKVLSMLSDEDIMLIRIYFEENMSLVKTCDRLLLHKNTLQYQLNRVYQKCGLNPRRFQDAVILYLASKI